MQRVWKDVGVQYRQLKSNPPANAEELCGCLNNYFGEEIHQELNKVSTNLKNPKSCFAGWADFFYFRQNKIHYLIKLKVEL